MANILSVWKCRVPSFLQGATAKKMKQNGSSDQNSKKSGRVTRNSASANQLSLTSMFVKMYELYIHLDLCAPVHFLSAVHSSIVLCRVSDCGSIVVCALE